MSLIGKLQSKMSIQVVFPGVSKPVVLEKTWLMQFVLLCAAYPAW